MSVTTVQTSTAPTADHVIQLAQLTGDLSFYVAATAKIKSGVKIELQARQDAAIMALDLATATAMINLRAAFMGAKATPSAQPVDRTQQVADTILTLLHAAASLSEGDVTVDGVDQDRLADLVAAGTGTWVSSIESAVRASLTVRSSSNTESTDIQAHVSEFLAQAQPGTFYSVAQLVNFDSAAKQPGLGSGAVAARLVPSSGKPTSLVGDFTVQARVEGQSPLGVVTGN